MAAYSNPVKPGQTRPDPVKSEKIKGSQESEQIMGGPLCGLLAPPETVNPGPTRSNPVKPGQTKSNQIKPEGVGEGRNWACRWRKRPGEFSLLKPGQTESNRIKPMRGKYLWHTELHGSGMGFGGGFRIKISLLDKNVAHWGHKPEFRKLLEINGPFPRFVERIMIMNDFSQTGQTESNQIKPVRGKYLWHTKLHESGMGFGGV
jgi:hypothetical protein